MFNILLTGVGGQGTVLAAKVLAMAAAAKGWHVRTAETIGMAQRGGSVTSHVRMGNLGEEVYAPLVTHGTADLIIAFEPGEGARQLPYLAQNGALITATTAVEPVSAALSSKPYRSKDVIDGIKRIFYNEYARDLATSDRRGQPRYDFLNPTDERLDDSQRGSSRRSNQRRRVIPVDDRAITDALGGNRRVLNSALLAAAVARGGVPLSIDDLRAAVAACVKPQFVEMNLDAIDAGVREMRRHGDA